MGAISAISDGIGAVKRNPIIPAVILAYALVASAVVSLQLVEPLLLYPGMLVLYAFMPFFVGGLIGMVHEGLTGKTSVNRFVDAGASSYLSILGGGVILGVLTTITYFAVFVVSLVFSVFVFSAIAVGGTQGLEGLSMVSVLLLVVFSLVSLLIVFLPLFVLQFFPAAIVVDDLGFVDSFKRSAGLVKNQFLSVLGFDAVSVLLGLLVQIPTAYLFYATYSGISTMPTGGTMFDLLSTTELAIYFGLTIVVTTLIGTVSQSYYVAFYDQLPRGEAA